VRGRSWRRPSSCRQSPATSTVQSVCCCSQAPLQAPQHLYRRSRYRKAGFFRFCHHSLRFSTRLPSPAAKRPGGGRTYGQAVERRPGRAPPKLAPVCAPRPTRHHLGPLEEVSTKTSRKCTTCPRDLNDEVRNTSFVAGIPAFTKGCPSFVIMRVFGHFHEGLNIIPGKFFKFGCLRSRLSPLPARPTRRRDGTCQARARSPMHHAAYLQRPSERVRSTSDAVRDSANAEACQES